jgi:tetratricopeptide (TPR) repeat protein
MDREVVPDELRAHIGVSCRTCHGVETSTIDGNGSYVLAARPLPLPDRLGAGGFEPESVAAHKQAMGPAREQCASCHRAFLEPDTGHPHFFAGTDEPGFWQDSSYAGNKLRLDTPVQERDCVDCHMQREVVDPQLDPAADQDGSLISHRFLGGHTYLAAMRNDPDTLARVQAFLREVASVDVAALELPNSERRLLGQGVRLDQLRGRVSVDLVVRNRSVGHRFPGGTRDAQHTFIALRVLDDEGSVLAEIDESEAHVLRAAVVDDEGEIQDAREVENLRAAAFDHTVGPRDAIVVRYELDLGRPELAARLARTKQLQIEARLLHRSRTPELAATTCEQAKTPRGRAFLAGTKKLLGQAIDPCVEPPLTEISRSVLTIDHAGSSAATSQPDHERLWELGIGLYHQVQERLPEARAALEQALVVIEQAKLAPEERAAAQARVLAVLGAVAARQGRVDEALALADRIAELKPEHPYPHLLRGRALAQVWRWEQAVPHLRRAREISPTSPTLAAELAIALGSAGMYPESYAVAAEGLAYHPRQPELLRAQALALQALDDPRAEEALEAYFDHRTPDVQPHLGAACGERDPACARERVPVHVHEDRG